MFDIDHVNKNHYEDLEASTKTCALAESPGMMYLPSTWWLKGTKKHSQHDRLRKSGPLQSQKTVT